MIDNSQIETEMFYSPSLRLDWNYDVYLPSGYDEKSGDKYPVLYLLHGLGGNHRNLLERFDSQQMLDDLVEQTGQKLIVVFVDGFNSFYINGQNGGMQMEDAVMQNLVPLIERNYHIAQERSQHAIGGISMGGYGAARLALKYADYWSSAALISPAVWQHLPLDNKFRKTLHAWQSDTEAWSEQFYELVFPTSYLKKAQDVSFYVESTAKDTVVPIADVASFVNKLTQYQVKTKFIQDNIDDHNWTYWAKVAPQAYQWVIEQFKNARK
ncbi:alpha/beta hydrolase-fold protein [Lactobacillus sp. ESL0731]|uniref:alpha/beta hydrolase n=1 Tax=unclassified Lactobacillus TaxID=2620435 RepID=UPI0023FA154E|nr:MULTISPECIES: YqiA/YcfP family alpha/beta fold hydrolase [unclassified Lactobacillus]WEV51525.1 alpha/beta hydrolase-fold protein [Lactobacillus sp. ESL0700]WEV62653.1 alpha/beta hydrolase-fold protein [Lactobacillus sp. ESL0731]